MATMKLDEAWTYARNAGADLSAKLHYLAKVDTDGDIVLAGSGDPVLGIIYEVAALNKPVTVMFGAIGKCILGATVAAGARVQSDGNGKAITLAGGVAFGIALEGGLVNEIVPVAFVG